MTKFRTNKGAAALIIAAVLLAVSLLFTGCKQPAGNSGGGDTPAPTPTVQNYAITFSVEGGNGTLKAKADGIAETAASPITVAKGKTVTFTAEPVAGYRIKEWKADETAIQGNNSNTYTHTVTKAVTVKVNFELIPQAILTLDAGKLTIKVKAKTADGSLIQVEGCNETTLANDVETELHAKGTKVTLKGKITELECRENQLAELNVQGLTSLEVLDCSYNQLSTLNVQGLTALKKLSCHANQLTVLDVQGCTSLEQLGCTINKLEPQAMTKILNALPAREASDYAKAKLYSEQPNSNEGNCKDFTQPESLKTAFDKAKGRNWKLQKLNAYGGWKDI